MKLQYKIHERGGTRMKRDIVENEEIQEFELKEMKLDAVEILETAIAPGNIGFGCGCNAWFGAYCG